MKTLKKALTIFCLLCFCLTSSAQRGRLDPEELLKIQKEDIQNTPCIFEGTVIKQYTKNGTIVVCSVIKITKIFRGSPQIKLGTIKIITEQSPNRSDTYPGLGMGATYIIFAKPDNFHLYDTVKADNSITVKSLLGYDYPVVISGTNSANWDGSSKFKTKDDIYSFFKENGLTVHEEQK